MKIPRAHLLVLIAMCCLVAVNIGLLSNVQGLFLDPIAQELGVLKGAVSLTITISSICGGLGGMAVPRFMGTKHLRPLVVVLAAVSGLSTAALGLCHGVTTMYLLCVIRGLASGMLGMVFATAVLNNWFRARIGLFTSIAVGCSGIAGSVFSLLFSDIIESLGWRVAYGVMAVCAVLLILPTILFVPAATPEEVRLVPFGETSIRLPCGVSAGPVRRDHAPINRLVVALIVLFSVLVVGPASMGQHLPGLAQSYGQRAAIGATMLSASMVVNTVGKVGFGALSDRTGARRTILLYAVLVAAALVGLLLVRSTGLLIGLATLYGLTFSLNTVGITLATREICGQEDYARVYPVATLACSTSYAVFSSINGYVYDFTGGYAASLVIVLIMMGAGVAAILAAYARAGVRER